MKVEKKVARVGNSLGIIIDRTLNASLKVKKGDMLEIECKENKLVIERKNKGDKS